MQRISPFEGIILPCLISVIETHPGEAALVPYNATEFIVREIQNPSLQNLAAEVTRRLNLAIHALEKEQTGNPDLVMRAADAVEKISKSIGNILSRTKIKY